MCQVKEVRFLISTWSQAPWGCSKPQSWAPAKPATLEVKTTIPFTGVGGRLVQDSALPILSMCHSRPPPHTTTCPGVLCKGWGQGVQPNRGTLLKWLLGRDDKHRTQQGLRSDSQGGGRERWPRKASMAGSCKQGGRRKMSSQRRNKYWAFPVKIKPAYMAMAPAGCFKVSQQ